MTPPTPFTSSASPQVTVRRPLQGLVWLGTSFFLALAAACLLRWQEIRGPKTVTQTIGLPVVQYRDICVRGDEPAMEVSTMHCRDEDCVAHATRSKVTRR